MSFEKPPKNEQFEQLPTPDQNDFERKTYNLESGSIVEVSARELNGNKEPEGKQEKMPKGAIIFLPGWGMDAENETARKLGGAFADGSQGLTYAITTRAEAMHEKDTLLEEAKAIAQFIKEKGIKEVTLAGHSQGGDKAINVVTILQEDLGMQVKGLVLIGATGLYSQTPTGLVAGFSKDSLLNTPKTLARNARKHPEAIAQGNKATTDLVFGIIREIAKSRLDYPKRFLTEIREMAAVNPRLAALKVPIVLLTGAYDPISNPEKIIPAGEEDKIMEAWKREEETPERETFIDPREKFLQKNLFPNSPYVRMVIPEKFGHHGIPLFRTASVARASLYLLKRFHRRENTNQ